MDRLDAELLAQLVDDGRVTFQELADRVNLGASATRDRVRQLRSRGIISGFAARVDEAALGFRVDAIVEIDLAAGDDGAAFSRRARDLPAVVEILHATGDHDFLLRLKCRDTDELHTMVAALKTTLGAARTYTRIVLHETLPRRPRLA